MAHYTVSRYVQDRQKWKSIQGKYSSWQPGNGSSSSDIKRPRKTPPPLPETRGQYIYVEQPVYFHSWPSYCEGTKGNKNRPTVHLSRL